MRKVKTIYNPSLSPWPVLVTETVKGHPALLARTHTVEGLEDLMGNIRREKSRDAQYSTPAELGCVTVGFHVSASGAEQEEPPVSGPKINDTRVPASPTPCFSSRQILLQHAYL